MLHNQTIYDIFLQYTFYLICKNLLPYGKSGAIVISAFLFSLMHISPITMVFTFAIGILLGILYEYTGSLKLPMLIHFINNGLASLVSILQENNANSYIIILISLLIYVFIACGIFGIIYYISNYKKNRSYNLATDSAIGYNLPLSKFILRFILNPGFIALMSVYAFFYVIIFIGYLFLN